VGPQKIEKRGKKNDGKSQIDELKELRRKPSTNKKMGLISGRGSKRRVEQKWGI